MRRSWAIAAALLVSLPALALGDGPEISRSLGKKGGVLVLWPRLLHEGVQVEGDVANAAAAQVQAALVKIAQSLNERVDVRPAPERVCPKETGCRATALGAVVVVQGEGCAVVATISAPGASPAKLVPWVSKQTLKGKEVAFRKPPEAAVQVTDFTPCGELAAALEEGTSKVAEALRGVMGG